MTGYRRIWTIIQQFIKPGHLAGHEARNLFVILLRMMEYVGCMDPKNASHRGQVILAKVIGRVYYISVLIVMQILIEQWKVRKSIERCLVGSA